MNSSGSALYAENSPAYSKTVVFFSLCLSLLLYSVPASADKIKVVATIAPLADFARQVGGDKVEVTLLLPPGASPHTFEPTPKVVREISQARLFLKIGSGLEFWADRMLQSAPANIADRGFLFRGRSH